MESNKKINSKNAIDITTKHIIYLIFYKRKTKKLLNKILEIIKIILETIVSVKKNRNFKRIRKLPLTKWSSIGNRFKL